MMLSFKRAAAAQLGYAIVGKLPSRGDFIRVNASHAVVAEFDELVAQGMELAGLTEGGVASYAAAQPVDFFYVARDGQWAFIGVLQPSHDQAGRRYPLIAGVTVPLTSFVLRLQTLPLLLELFYVGLREQLASAVENSVDLLACRQFLEAQATDGGWIQGDGELAESLLARFFKRQSAQALAGLSGHAGSAALEQMLINTGFYLDLMRRYHSPATSQLLLFPLPERKGEEALFQGSWLALYAAYAEALRMPTLPSFFAIRQGGASSLAIAPHRIPEKFLAGLFGAPLDRWCVLDTTDSQPPWSSHPLYAETCYVLGRLLADPQLPLGQLVGHVADIGARLARAV
jgi:type VI secretion system protein ImpM